ncbi:MAG: SLBB domain-containing protein [Bacteroidota bacterium]
MLRLSLCLLLAALAAPHALAQAEDGRIGRSELVVNTTPGYYVYHQPGEATVQVAVEGAVRNPGLYEVAVGTTLNRLLALTGGATYDGRTSDERQRVEVQLFRPSEGVVYRTTTSDVAADPDSYPALREGDTVIVDVIRKRGFSWRDGIAIAGSLTGVAFLINALSGN